MENGAARREHHCLIQLNHLGPDSCLLPSGLCLHNGSDSAAQKLKPERSPEAQFPLDEFFELVRPSACGFDHFGVRVDQVVSDEVQARFDVGVFKLDEVQPCSDLFLHSDFIQLVAGGLLGTQRREGGLDHQEELCSKANAGQRMSQHIPEKRM